VITPVTRSRVRDRDANERDVSEGRSGLDVRGVEVVRDGRLVPVMPTPPILSSVDVRWEGMALETHRTPASVVDDHEHQTHTLHLQTSGLVGVEWTTGGERHAGRHSPGTIYLLPRGSRHRLTWDGPTSMIVVALHPGLLTQALEETAHRDDIELAEHWDLSDRHIAAMLLALRADLEDGLPAGRLYGESLGVALAVYLARRYAAWPVRQRPTRGGLPTYRLRRVLDYIAAHLDRDLRLSDLASVSGLSPHYFAELFRQRTGTTPHQYVLMRRIERAKHLLRDRERTVLDVALLTGFQNQAHFGGVFRRAVGMTPTRYRAEL
jgi:AraC family transcriptional regulator